MVVTSFMSEGPLSYTREAPLTLKKKHTVLCLLGLLVSIMRFLKCLRIISVAKVAIDFISIELTCTLASPVGNEHVHACLRVFKH